MSEKNFYSSGSDIIELVITDCTGRKINKYKANSNDVKSIMQMYQSVLDKYGHKMVVTIRTSNNDEEDLLQW